jgi:hypothetical protein
LGDCYDLLNYSKALPFLLMLPNSIYWIVSFEFDTVCICNKCKLLK